MKGLGVFVAAAVVAAAAVICCCDTARADGLDDLVVALGGESQSQAACPCGEGCKCAGGQAELMALRRYRDRMEAWVAENGYRDPKLYVKPASMTVADEGPVLLPGQTMVCDGGQCRIVNTGPSYTNGAYTAWIPARSESPPVRYNTGPVRRWVRGGSCGPFGCPQ